MKIAVLALYFGNLPQFAQLFLASCDKNKSVDFLLVGDAWKGLEGKVPENCFVKSIAIEEFKIRAQERIGVSPSFNSPYKICDYKPALGEILEDMLIGYDYWGFCDIDIVLGDISVFIQDLNEYDVFSTSKEYLSGPLFFFRNIPEVNALYRQSKDYKMILSSNQHFSFTECALAWAPLMAGKSIMDIETPIESMTEVIVKSCQQGIVKAHFETLSCEPERSFSGRVMVEGVRVRRGGKDYIHYHHLHNKGSSIYTFPRWAWREVPENYCFSKYGAYAENGSGDLLFRFSQFSGKWKKRVEKRISRRGRSSEGHETKIT